MRRNLVLVMAGVLLLASLHVGTAAGDVDLQRLAGEDRFATATVISEEAFPGGQTTALLSRGDEFADALAAGALAGALEAPVLLSASDAIPLATMEELERLEVSQVVLLGGQAALDSAVEQELRDAGLDVERVAGATRYATAAAVAVELGADQIGAVDGRRTALLASGVNFPDALAAGPMAYAARLPILLTPPDQLAEETAAAIRDLGVEQVLVLGGPAAVSDDVVAALDVPARRLQGPDRTRTAAAVAGFAVATLGFDHSEIVLARGDAFPDALAAAPYAGAGTSPVLLSESSTTLGAGAREYLAAAGGDVEQLTALGGPAALSDAVLQEASEALEHLDTRLLFSRWAIHQRPDGTEYAVADIFLRRTDGTVQQVSDAVRDFGADTYGGAGYLSPSWSPDGRQIAATLREGSSEGIAVLAIDGSGLRRLAEDGFGPEWAPDGSVIAFSGRQGRGGGIWFVEPEGTGLHQLPNAEGSGPSWSPDSQRLAYVTADTVGIVNRDGTGGRTIAVPGGGQPQAVSWSPDGETLAVTTGGQFGFAESIELVAADGTGTSQTLVGPDSGLLMTDAPTWRADGAILAFGASQGSMMLDAQRIFEIRPDGSGLRELTAGTGPDYRWPQG